MAFHSLELCLIWIEVWKKSKIKRKQRRMKRTLVLIFCNPAHARVNIPLNAHPFCRLFSLLLASWFLLLVIRVKPLFLDETPQTNIVLSDFLCFYLLARLLRRGCCWVVCGPASRRGSSRSPRHQPRWTHQDQSWLVAVGY